MRKHMRRLDMLLLAGLICAAPCGAFAQAQTQTAAQVAAAKKKKAAAAKKKTAKAAPKKKTVADVLSQAKEDSRGAGAKLNLVKVGTSLPQSELGFAGKPGPNLESVKPPKSSEILRSEVNTDRAEYIRVLDQQIKELFKLTERFGSSPNRGEMWLRLAELYVEKASLIDAAAQDEYDKKLRLFQSGKSKAKPFLDQSEAREYNKKAIQLYEWFVRDFPKDQKVAQAYFFLGFNHFDLGNVKKGVEYYEKLTKQFPNSPFVKEAYFALGEYYFENDKWAQAYKEYTPLLKDKKHRLHTFALYKAAWCLYRLGKNKEALQYLENIIRTGRVATGDDKLAGKVVNRSRLESEALRDVVMFYASIGSSANASAYFRNLVGDGDTTAYLERLAYYYSDKGNRDASDDVFKQLIRQNPVNSKSFEFQYQIVQNYFYAKNSPKFREELYTWVNNYGPDSEWAKANATNKELIANSQKLRESTLRNWVLQNHQTAQNSHTPYSQAIANDAYQLYLKNFPQSASIGDMHFYYGELLYDMGKYDEAGAQYLWVTENAPKSKFADKAATNMVLAVEKAVPNDQELAKRVGTSLDPMPLDPKVERFIKAGRWYIEHFPTAEKTPEIRFRIGRLYYQSNQFDSATAEFKGIVQKYPTTKYAEYSANLLLDIYNLRKDYAGLEKTGAELLAVPSIAASKAGADIRGVLEKATFKQAQDLEGQKKFDESAVHYEAFAKQNPTSNLAVVAIFNAGVNHERSGNPGQAQVDYEKVMASKGPDADKMKKKVRRLLAKLAQDGSRIEEAARLYRESALDSPDDSNSTNMMFNAALLYQVSGHWDLAEKSYNDYIKSNKKHTQENLEATFQIAKIEERQGHKAAAELKYKEYIGGNPSNSFNLMEAQGKLYEMAAATNAKETYSRHRKTLQLAEQLKQENKKFDPSWAAKAKLADCETIFNDLKSIKFPRDVSKLKKTLFTKVDVLNRLLKNTAEVIKLNSGNEIVTALQLNARAYDHLAQALRAAPLPAGLSKDEEKQYREGVEKQFVAPNLDKAREFSEKAVKRAWELEAYNPAYHQAFDNMHKVDPKVYYDDGENPSETRTVNWMAQ